MRIRAALLRPLAALLPRSLLWQTFLLISLLFIFVLGAWSEIFRYFQEPARARDVAQMIVSVVNLTRTALINADVDRRIDLLIELAAQEGIRIYPAETSDETLPLPATRPMRLLMTEVRAQLGEHTRFASRWKTLDAFWVSFRLDPDDEDEYWVMLAPERFEQHQALEWLAWGVAAALVALLGAYFVVSRISARVYGVPYRSGTTTVTTARRPQSAWVSGRSTYHFPKRPKLNGMPSCTTCDGRRRGSIARRAKTSRCRRGSCSPSARTARSGR